MVSDGGGGPFALRHDLLLDDREPDSRGSTYMLLNKGPLRMRGTQGFQIGRRNRNLTAYAERTRTRA